MRIYKTKESIMLYRRRYFSIFYFLLKKVHFLDVIIKRILHNHNIVLMLWYSSSIHTTCKLIISNSITGYIMSICRCNTEHPVFRAPLLFIFSITIVCFVIYILQNHFTRVLVQIHNKFLLIKRYLLIGYFHILGQT